MNVFFHYIWSPVAIFLVGYILFRWMGKKAVAEMSSFDLLVTMLLSTAIVDPIASKSLGDALYFALAIAVVYILFSRLTLLNGFKKWLTASPSVLIQHGDINERSLRQNRMTVEQLMSALRAKGFTQATDVEFAVLEEVGKISVIPKAEHRPIQPSDIQIPVNPTFIPIPLVMDGEILDKNLAYLRKDRTWLDVELQKHQLSLAETSHISIATLNHDGTLTVDSDVPLNPHPFG